jgi:hypothetical protein
VTVWDFFFKHAYVGTRRAAFMEQVGQTKHTALLDFAFPHQKRGTPRPYINKRWANDQRQSKIKTTTPTREPRN